MHPKLTETLSKYSTIILVGGGTGGHIQPIVSIAQVLRNHNLHWIGGKDSNEEKEAKSAGISFQSISTLKLATTRSPKVLLYPFILIRGILEARKILRSVIARNEAIQEPGSPHSAIAPFAMTKPIAVFSKGGPGSVAIGIAAWTLRIPLYIHESDTIPGRSNRILGKFATKIFLGFDSAKKYFKGEKCETIGQILHPVFSLQHSNTPTLQHYISWKTDKPHILVICGSQGARVVFDSIIEQFSEENPYEWIVALGKLNAHMKEKFDTIDGVNALEWISQEDIAHLLSDTDIAITRGSATTLAEIDVFGVKKIIIPLPHSADNHQYHNAREYEKKGDILLEQKNLDQLKNIIKQLGQNLVRSDI